MTCNTCKILIISVNNNIMDFHFYKNEIEALASLIIMDKQWEDWKMITVQDVGNQRDGPNYVPILLRGKKLA